MPSGMGTESLGIIGWLFALNGPLEGGIESSFSGTGWGAKGDFRWIFTSIPAFSKAASTILRMHMPSGMGTESLGIIGCIFAENGPLESGIESSFSGTGWEVLRVISGGFFTPIPAFSKAASNIFRMHLPSGMGTENLGIIRCIFAENGPLEAGIESSFSGNSWGAKGEFRWIFYPNPCIFEGGPHHFPNAHALRYRLRKFGDHRMYIPGEFVLRKWHWIMFQRYPLGC